MIATNELLNRINDWNAPEQNVFKRHIGSRLTNLCVTAPMQTLAVAQNIIIAPFQVVGMTLNLATKPVCSICSSQALRDFRANLPNLGDFIRTLARIVGNLSWNPSLQQLLVASFLRQEISKSSVLLAWLLTKGKRL